MLRTLQLSLLFSALGCGINVTAAAPPSSAETFRLVHVQVLEADGKPAAHRDVYLRGWERRALGPSLDWSPEFPTTEDDLTKARKSGWLFTTNEAGECTVRIWNLAGWKDAAGRPGWGVYGLLINPGPKDAGAVSQRFCAFPTGEYQTDGDWPPEWGQPLPLPPAGLHLAMCLHAGFTLFGQLLDDRDHRTPLPNVRVATWNDLLIDTHTGYGGQIFRHDATTDSNGEFKLEHQYDNKLYIQVGGVWMSTQGPDGWVPQERDVIDPSGELNQRLTLGVLVNQQFHYMGRVTDAQGQPVSNADVVAGISSQPKAESWGDTHHFERTKTSADGKYDLAASTPWGTFLEAEDPIHGRVDLKWPDTSPTLPPGHYDLVFPARPNK